MQIKQKQILTVDGLCIKYQYLQNLIIIQSTENQKVQLLMLSKQIFISISLIFIACLLLPTVNSQNSTYPTFAEYVTQFNKTYTGDELTDRQTLYNATVAALQAITDSYTPAVNNFSDWTAAERLLLRGLMTVKVNSVGSPRNQIRLRAPDSVNWRTANKVTTPKNQGRCASGWAFASVGYAESKLIIENNQSINIDLSEQRILECSSSSDCNGGFLELAMDAVVKTIPFESVYPYSRQNYYAGNICTVEGEKIGDIVQNYYNLSTSQLEEFVSQRPIAVSVVAENWEYYGSGVFRCSAASASQQVNHAALLVGYTSDVWILKNSWGTNWGEGGFITISKTQLSNCRIGRSAHRTKVAGSFESSMSFVFLCLMAILLIIA